MRLLRLTFTFAALSAAPLFAQEPQPAPSQPAQPGQAQSAADARQKASYGIGYSIGGSLANNFKQQGIEFDTDQFMRGLRDALGGKEAAFTEEELRAAMTVFQKEVQARQEQQLAELEARFKADAEKNQKEGEAFLKANAAREGVKSTASGLQYQVLKSGSGKSPDANDRVKVHYHGTLIDGTVFDSSVERGEPIELSVNRVIPGWTEALQLMKVGDKWKLFVPSKLAYAEDSPGAPIGPNATLIFEVELLDVTEVPNQPAAPTTPRN